MATALITGASSGIGLELARVMAREKLDLILVARSESILIHLKQELESKYKTLVTVIAADLSKAGAGHLLADKIQAQKIQVDILVNNAGFGDHGAFVDSDWQKISEMIQLNITTLTELTHIFIPQMKARKSGKILNVASTAAFQAGPWMTVYYATKAYVLSFTEGIAEELKPYNIKVTALCPGPTRSGFQSAAGMGRVDLFDKFKIPNSLDVAEFGYAALMQGKVIAIHGWVNRILISSGSLLPRSWTRKIAMRLQKSRL